MLVCVWCVRFVFFVCDRLCSIVMVMFVFVLWEWECDECVCVCWAGCGATQLSETGRPVIWICCGRVFTWSVL